MNNASRQVVVITGASRGIGRACALQLASDKTELVLIARQEQDLQEVAKICQSQGAKVHLLAIDLLNTKELQQKLQEVKTHLGKVDVLINNAGVWQEKPFEQGDMDDWDNALDINLKSAIHATRYCLEAMGEGGAIIFIGSTASRRAYAGGTNYCAAKFGLLAFAGALFEDIREKGIKVCSVLPGLVNTDMHKDDSSMNPSKMIQPQDVASTVQFLLSMPANVCPTEITLMPQKNPKNYYAR